MGPRPMPKRGPMVPEELDLSQCKALETLTLAFVINTSTDGLVLSTFGALHSLPVYASALCIEVKFTFMAEWKVDASLMEQIFAETDWKVVERAIRNYPHWDFVLVFSFLPPKLRTVIHSYLTQVGITRYRISVEAGRR